MFCKASLAVALTALLLTPLVLSAAENVPSTAHWPQFRGPNRNGVSPEMGLLKQWPRGGPKLLWKTKGAGRGYSSLAIADGRIYTMGDDGTDEHIICFDESNGQLRWKTKLGPAYARHSNESWQSSRSTPTVDGELVFALTPLGSLVCLESATGKIRWRKHMDKDLGGKKAESWGYSESVLVDGDKLLCTPGSSRATMVALNKKTGELLWKAVVPNSRGACHSSIVVSEVGNTRVYVQLTHGYIFGVRASDGKLLWSENLGLQGVSAVCSTPIVRGDLVFYAIGYGHGAGLLRQVPAAGGGVKVEKVYEARKEMTNKHGGVVMVGNCVYGDTDDRGMLWCADVQTGKVLWKNRTSGRGSATVTAADGHLYVRSANGMLALVKASPEGYKEISSFKVPHSGGRPSWSYSVITGGKLYLREGDYILCYDVRAN